MAGLYPIPTTRVSNQLVQLRLQSQLSSDQLDILRLQSQVSTGRRIISPSEDAPAAQRAISLQRLLELKAQAQINLNASQSYLDATDVAVARVTDLLNQVRSSVLGVADSTASDAQRRAAAVEVRQAIEQLVDTGNQSFRGRYLFGGSRFTQQPFVIDGKHVVFQGNEQELRSFSDLDLASVTNLPGNAVFGALSSRVRGSVDLNPIVTRETRIADLNGGAGVQLGSIGVSDGTVLRVVDLSNAATLGDIADLLAANAPAGRTLTARVTPSGLQLQLDAAGGGNLTIHEVGSGTTAAELGINNTLGVGTGSLTGTDLNPRLSLTTQLRDLLGSRATAVLSSPGDNNDLVFEALLRGPDLNGLQVQYVDDDLLRAAPGLTAGGEFATYSASPTAAQASLALSGFGNNLVLTAATGGSLLNGVQIELVNAGAIGDAATASYDGLTKRLTLGIDGGGTTSVQALINAINVQGVFTAAHDPSDPVDGAFNPAALVQAADIGVVSGNTGQSGGDANTIFIHVDPGSSTASNVLASVQANSQITALFDVRLDERDRLSASAPGAGLIVGEAAATAVGGGGIEPDLSSGLQIQNGGKTYLIDVSGANTLEDLLNTLNGSPAQVLAELDDNGTGIRIRSRLSGGDFAIGENGGNTAAHLGVRSFTADNLLTDLNYGRGITPISGTDFTIRRNDGVDLAIDINGAITVGDVLERINNHPDNLDPATRVIARLAVQGNGIEIFDDNPVGGGTLQVFDAFGSDVAAELGLIPYGQNSATSSAGISAAVGLNFQPPFHLNTGLRIAAAQAGAGLNDVEVVFQSGLSGDLATATFDSLNRQLVVQIDPSATTASTILSAINVEGTFSAELDLGNDPTNDGSGVVGTVGVIGTTAGGAAQVLTGRDSNPLEVDGVFNSLIRIHDALEANDLVALERAFQLLDQDLERVTFARAEIGSSSRALDTLRGRLEDEDIQLQASLSNEIDVDFTKAVSDLAARQASLQASLQLAAQSLQLTLLDYL
jgi:flagellar hook-associated protein 3 FlgL